jgi:hypothetical protein
LGKNLVRVAEITVVMVGRRSERRLEIDTENDV